MRSSSLFLRRTHRRQTPCLFVVHSPTPTSRPSPLRTEAFTRLRPGSSSHHTETTRGVPAATAPFSPKLRSCVSRRAGGATGSILVHARATCWPRTRRAIPVAHTPWSSRLSRRQLAQRTSYLNGPPDLHPATTSTTTLPGHPRTASSSFTPPARPPHALFPRPSLRSRRKTNCIRSCLPSSGTHTLARNFCAYYCRRLSRHSRTLPPTSGARRRRHARYPVTLF